jgi:hypothetical protein
VARHPDDALESLVGGRMTQGGHMQQVMETPQLQRTEGVRRRITIDPITRLEGHGKIEIS